MEGVVDSHDMIAEFAVIGVQDELKGQLPMALVLLKASAKIDTQLSKEIVAMLRKTIGPITVLKSAHIVALCQKLDKVKFYVTSSVRSLMVKLLWCQPPLMI